MRLPDFSDLGSFAKAGAPAPEPSQAVASVANPAAAAQATEQFGAQMEKTGLDLKNIQDIADVNNAMATGFQPKLRDLAQNYYSLQGNAAAKAMKGTDDTPSYGEQVQAAMRDTAAGLSGSAQRMFTGQAQHQVESELYKAAMHAGTQQIVYANQMNDAVQANDLHEAQTAQSGGDINTVKDTIARIQAREVLHQQSLGNDPDSEITKMNVRKINEASAVALFNNLSPAEQAKTGQSWFPNGTSATGVKDMGADYVKPYTPQQIAGIKSLVSNPSPYDALFQSIGKKYGIDPQELKLHAAVESSMNPIADNGQSKGLMQLSNGNIKSLGIGDPLDPAQSIEGAAKIMQQNGAKDTNSADLMYYGGSDPAQQGPNSRQYAANLAAVRGGTEQGAPAPASPSSLYGIPIEPQLALKLAETGHANNQKAQALQKIEYDKSVEAFAADPHFTSMLQVPDNIKAGFANEPKMQNYLEARASYNQKNSQNIADADTQQYGSGFYNLLQNIYSPGGLSKPNDLYQYMGNGGILTVPGFDMLKNEMAKINTPEGQAVAEAKGKLFADGARAIYGEAQSYGMRDLQGEALHHKWLAVTMNDYNTGIKAGKTPTQLLNPESPDYVGKSIPLFARSPAQILHQELQPAPESLDDLESDVKYGKATLEQVKPAAFNVIKQMAASKQFRNLREQESAMARFGLLAPKVTRLE